MQKTSKFNPTLWTALLAASLVTHSAQAGYISSFAGQAGTGTTTASVPGTNAGEGIDDANLAGLESARTISVTSSHPAAPLGAPLYTLFGVTNTAGNADGTFPSTTTEHLFTLNNTNATGSPLLQLQLGFYNTSTQTFTPSGIAVDGAGNTLDPSFDQPKNGQPLPTENSAPTTPNVWTPNTLTFNTGATPLAQNFQFSVDVPNLALPANTFVALKQVQAVPEPATYAMFALGLVAMAGYARRRKQQGEATAFSGLA